MKFFLSIGWRDQLNEKICQRLQFLADSGGGKEMSSVQADYEQ
jgi:hypothetical protein